MEYDIMDDNERGPTAVKLKGPVFLEASIFSEQVLSKEAYEQLEILNKDIKVRFIYSGKTITAELRTVGEVSTAHVAWRRTENTSNIKIPAIHPMVQESATEVGA
ncbi:hypothetical protein BS47DRAFT_109836 [Hydnum rufescens UP504]|uniref:Uncharacterized protein n=1 Tax=Hydnum rufescens UP504 TaxID=1448309 RepID=A0A9P6DSY6_9AGAM|nr:hypothetical protein BS47DRAFT_109836 [Hydnum rufescens UP504]